MAVLLTRGGPTGAVQLKQLASSKNIRRGRVIIAQLKANCLSYTAPIVSSLIAGSASIALAYVEISEELVVVESIAHHKLVRNLKPSVCGIMERLTFVTKIPL